MYDMSSGDSRASSYGETVERGMETIASDFWKGLQLFIVRPMLYYGVQVYLIRHCLAGEIGRLGDGTNHRVEQPRAPETGFQLLRPIRAIIFSLTSNQ